MTTAALALLLLFDPDPTTSAAFPLSVDPQASCKQCHADVAEIRAREGDPHAELGCADCHLGATFNPHVTPAVDPAKASEADAFAALADHGAGAYASCSDCHASAVADWRGSVHGPGAGTGKRPACADCHGDIHALVADASKRSYALRCIGCHGFEREGEPPREVDTYRDTVHGRMLALGNARAAACADCHGTHAILKPEDPASMVSRANRVETCKSCHPSSNPSFADTVAHEPHAAHDRLGWFVALGFAVLTLGVILMLFVHMVLDFVRAARKALGGEPEEHATGGPIAADAEVVRFDGHMRLQHLGLMLSFTLLVLTGWPLKAASVEPSGPLVAALGGQAMLALVHRIAGSLLIVVGAYHLVWLGWLLKNRKLSLAMLPALEDARDLVHNLLYYVGLRAERPAFARWAYHEKFDYWAVFWGMFIMGGSGLILWFPAFSARWLPAELVTLSLIAHSDEALLALLAIFLWHFYNVHLRPTVFPMSWVWLHGRIRADVLWEEHRAEYQQLYGSTPPASPARATPWHRHPLWSYLAVAILAGAGAGVALADAFGIYGRVTHGAALLGFEESPAEPMGPAAPSVFTEGVDLYQRCFGCHSRERYEAGGAGFPHKQHFEDLDVPSKCTGCHEAVWHRTMTTSTKACLECHEPDEIGRAPAVVPDEPAPPAPEGHDDP